MTAKNTSSAKRIPNALIREAGLSSSVTIADICYRVGMVRADQDGHADTSTMKRRLGINIAKGGHNKTIEESLARQIAAAIDVDLVELYAGVDLDEPVTQQCSRCKLGLVERSQSGLCGFCEIEIALTR